MSWTHKWDGHALDLAVSVPVAVITGLIMGFGLDSWKAGFYSGGAAGVVTFMAMANRKADWNPRDD